MFTGIIEEIGSIGEIRLGKDSARVLIKAKTVLEGTKIGDSIAVNGICLTVTSKNEQSFTADVMSETIKRTCFSTMKVGSLVNLERALPANGRFGGHIVSGHIDGTGTIKSMVQNDIAVLITITASENILRLVVEKGSIAIDGISLTVASLTKTDFTISAIPHTLQNTILHQKKVGDMVHLETDILGKYVEKLLNGSSNDTKAKSNKSTNLTKEFLLQNGF